MRALAVGMVLLHHAKVPFVPGGFAGVDVFFVISGFVITMQLLRELDRRGRINLLDFYGRRAKRLLPAAGVVLIFTSLAAWLMVSRVQWGVIATDIKGAALYVVNWVLAARSVDYLAEDVEPSPVQHYWSLAVEEQFYVIWPLIIVALAWFATARAGRATQPSDGASTRPVPRRLLALGLVVIVVLPSLAWSVWLTEQSPDRAYFVTTTRLWELGLGALVAIGIEQWQRMRPAWGVIVAWLGLVTVLSGALLQDTSAAWPGLAALVPTVGTAAVIIGGGSAGRRGPRMILGVPLLVWVGGLSYSLYLWHWPLLRMAEWQWGSLSVLSGLLVVTASAVPAWLCYRFIENPIRRAPALHTSPRFALSVGVNSTLAALVAGLLLGAAASSAVAPTAADPTSRTRDLQTAFPPDSQEPRAEQPGDSQLARTITPDPALATDDVPADRECQADREETTPLDPCVLGDTTASFRVALTGDSKMTQWMTALDSIAKREGWRLEVYTKSGCAFSEAMTINEGVPYETCATWGDAVFASLLEEPADVVLTSAVRTGAGQPEASAQALRQGYLAYWQPLAEKGTQVIALSDTPYPALDVPAYECVADHPEDYDEVCSWPYRTTTSSRILRRTVGELDGSGHFIDMDPWVCPGGTCVSVYRNILTYRNGSHITRTFTEVLAEPLADELVPLVDAIADERTP